MKKERGQVADRKGGLRGRPRGKSRVTSRSGKGPEMVRNRSVTETNYRILSISSSLVSRLRRELGARARVII